MSDEDRLAVQAAMAEMDQEARVVRESSERQPETNRPAASYWLSLTCMGPMHPLTCMGRPLRYPVTRLTITASQKSLDLEIWDLTDLNFPAQLPWQPQLCCLSRWLSNSSSSSSEEGLAHLQLRCPLCQGPLRLPLLLLRLARPQRLSCRKTSKRHFR